MFFSYTLCRMRRSPGPAAAMGLLGLVITLALCILRMSVSRMELQIEALYDQMEVSCAVTNLTGTQTDNLNLNSWVVRMFFSDTTTIAGEPLDRAFSSYIRDVRVKSTLSGQGTPNRLMTGVTDLDMDSRMRQENGCTVTWLEGYGPEIFSGHEPLCLVPETEFGAIPTAGDGERYLTLTFQGMLEGEAQRTFQVAGYYSGSTSSACYCAWNVIWDIFTEMGEEPTADSIRATIANNREIEAFRAYAGEWFAEVTPQGTPQLWEASPLYTYYPFAFEIYDATLVQTEDALANNIALMNFASQAILALSLAIGFLAAFLLIRSRARELALMQTMGTGKPAIFVQAFLEQALPTILGVLVAAAGFLILSAPPVGQIILFLCFDFAGAAAAIGWFLRQNLLTAMKEENE